MIPADSCASEDLSSPGHLPKKRSGRLLLFTLWVLVIAAVPIWTSFDRPGWDVAIYHSAIQTLAAGRDPYAEAISVQEIHHREALSRPSTKPKADAEVDPPYSYVYSPITLPLLRAIGRLPAAVSGTFYWFLYAAAVLAQLWIGLWATTRSERPRFAYLAPVAAFFPGLLANGILLSGNIAYILYALVFASAVRGWRRGSWLLFYLAVVSASCVKAPLLSLVVIPIFSSRKQWIPTAASVAAGIALFVVQPTLWPSLFHHYLEAVNLQFLYNRDFGCSPAGLLSGFLFDRNVPYSTVSLAFYFFYASLVLAVLFSLSRHFLSGRLSLAHWVPVLMVGVILLNPRLIEYDVAPLTIPLALIAWRSLKAFTPAKTGLLILCALFLILNALGLTSWELRKLIDGPLIVLLFACGSWTLFQVASREAQASAHSFEESAALGR